jgi:hypothetical protein
MVSSYLDFAENMTRRKIPLSMQDDCNNRKKTNPDQMQKADIPNKVTITRKERRYTLLDNASLTYFRIGLGYGSISFPIKPCLFM